MSQTGNEQRVDRPPPTEPHHASKRDRGDGPPARRGRLEPLGDVLGRVLGDLERPIADRSVRAVANKFAMQVPPHDANGRSIGACRLCEVPHPDTTPSDCRAWAEGQRIWLSRELARLTAVLEGGA